MKQTISFAVLLVVLLSVLFYKSFIPDYVSFSNDGPLGTQVSARGELPGAFYVLWDDLNWLGGPALAPGATISSGLRVSSGLPSVVFVGCLVLIYLLFRQRKCPRDAACCVVGTVCFTMAGALVVCMISQFRLMPWLPQYAGMTWFFGVISIGALNKI